MPATTPRSREDAKHETREALIRAGAEAFAELGLDAPSLDAICARAGRTRGAFYVHFRHRDDFVVAVVERVLGDFLDAVIARGDRTGDLEQTVRRFAGVLSAVSGSGDPGPAAIAAPLGELPVHRLLEACARSERVRARFARLLRDAIERVARAAAQGQSAGRLRADVPANEVGTLLVGIALGAIVALEVGVELDAERASRVVLTLLRGSGA